MKDSKNEVIRIAILTPYSMITSGLKTLLDQQNDMVVVGEGEPCQDGIDIVANCKPDIIVLEIFSTDPGNLIIISDLLKVWNKVRIILLTPECSNKFYLSAIQEGVIGLVFNTQPIDVLVKAIRKVYLGEVWIERTLLADLLTNLTNARLGFSTDPNIEAIDQLSPREQQVIHLIGLGLRNKQIGENLCISEITVRRHLTSIYKKLGVSDRLELLVFAHRHKLV